MNKYKLIFFFPHLHHLPLHLFPQLPFHFLQLLLLCLARLHPHNSSQPLHKSSNVNFPFFLYIFQTLVNFIRSQVNEFSLVVKNALNNFLFQKLLESLFCVDLADFELQAQLLNSNNFFENYKFFKILQQIRLLFVYRILIPFVFQIQKSFPLFIFLFFFFFFF